MMWRRAILRYFGIKEVKDKHRAIRIKKNISIFYAFVGWNCFGIIFYMLLKERLPKDKEQQKLAYRDLTGVSENVHIYQFSGLKFVTEYDLPKNTENEKEITDIEKAPVKVDEH